MGNGLSTGQVVALSVGVGGVITGLGVAVLYLLWRVAKEKRSRKEAETRAGEEERLRREATELRRPQLDIQAFQGLQAAVAEIHNHIVVVAAQLQQQQPPPAAEDEIQEVDPVDPHVAAVQAALQEIQNVLNSLL